jgi:hypothetical protein
LIEWQPIETAPKDGTLILVWRAAVLDRVAHHGIDMWSDKSQAWWSSLPSQQPTHWMPLPEPPRNA